MTIKENQRRTSRAASAVSTPVIEPIVDELPDLYAAMTAPVARCAPKDHKKKKNCANNPWCLIDIIDEKVGIWKAKPTGMVKLGPDPTALKRILRPPFARNKSAKLTPGGLKNLGATCYLNVLIQMLFHNLLVRDAVYNMQLEINIGNKALDKNGNKAVDDDILTSDAKTNKIAEKDTHMNMVVGALQDTFGHLDSCPKGVHDTSLFVDLLELNKSEQQDPQEFSKLFFAKLDESVLPLKDSSLPNIKQLIAGKETYSTTCKVCGAVSSQSNEYHEIGLNIQGCSDLQTAIDEYQALETLEGENQFSCSVCQRKTDAFRGVKIVETPDLLIFKLIRYYYDRKTNEKKKSQVRH